MSLHTVVKTSCKLSQNNFTTIPRNIVTSESQVTNEGESTQRLSIEKIILPVNNENLQISSPKRNPKCVEMCNIDPHNSSVEFAYEQQRLAELGQNQCKFADTGPQSEVDPHDPRVNSLMLHNKAVLENEEGEIENWSKLMRIIAIASVALTSLSMILALIYAFIMTLQVKESILICMIPIIFFVLESTWMIYISIVAARVSGLLEADATLFTYFLRLGYISVGIYIIQIAIMAAVKPISEIMSDFKKITCNLEEEKGKAYFAIGYFSLWSACVLNISVIGLSIIFTYLLRRHLRIKNICVLQYNTLPIGYQMFSHLQKTTVSLSKDK